MAQSNFPRRGTGPAIPETPKSPIIPKLGVYTFIDEDGNVTQIKKEKKEITMYYPNTPSKIETVIGDVFVIGVSDTIAMGIGDNTMAYAKYV